MDMGLRRQRSSADHPLARGMGRTPERLALDPATGSDDRCLAAIGLARMGLTPSRGGARVNVGPELARLAADSSDRVRACAALGVAIHQDAAVLGADLAAGRSLACDLGPGRQAYVLAAHGCIAIDGTELALRDGAVVAGTEKFDVTALEDSDVLIVDVPR